jgi:hypothetical protein
MDILDNYFIYLKNTTLLTEEEKYAIIPYICKYITIFNNVHEDEIELAHFTNNLIQIFSNAVGSEANAVGANAVQALAI